VNGKGRVWPREIQRTQDERTGATVWQVTNHPSIHHHLYFLTTSFSPDEKHLFFAGFRNGKANFYRADFPEGTILQLTDAADINSFSAVISYDGTILYFTQADRIVSLFLNDLSEKTLAQFPGGKLGEVDLSSDGRWLMSAIHLKDENGIVVCSAQGGEASIVYRQRNPIVHPQFHPTDASCIEFAQDPAPRMHVIRRDGTGLRCLYAHTNDEYVVHETWLGDAGDLAFVYWPYAIKRMNPSTGAMQTIAEFNAWHISPSRDGRYILCDANHPDIGMQLVETATGKRATVCFPQSSNAGSQWTKTRYAEKADFEAAARRNGLGSAEGSWMEMKTDTVYGPQWTHPHPSFSPSCRFAAFTSDRSGYSQVYVVEIPRELL